MPGLVPYHDFTDMGLRLGFDLCLDLGTSHAS
jgi:hypothetical protein